MEAPEHIQEGLKNIRQDMHLRWNPTAVCIDKGVIGAVGQIRKPKYDGRFEVWDKDPDGNEYMVMRVQNMDGSFRPPGEWLLEHIGMVNPERYNGDIETMIAELVDKPEALRECGTQKDSDDLIEAVSKWAQWVATPKSGVALKNRGHRLLST